MDMQSSRVKAVKSSPSMAVSVLAKQMLAKGEPVINLALGEPDYNVPAHVIEAAHQAMLAGNNHYTPPNGMDSLRQAIVDKFARENDLHYGLDEICVGNGAKQLLFNAFLATLEEGDEVITPAPYWVSYTDMAMLNGGVPVVIPCGAEQGFKVTAEQLEAAITPRTRWVMLNSPNNPSGAIFTREEFAALGKVLERHPKVLIISDEIYEHIVLGDQPFVSFVTACPQLRERTLLINGVSKAYAMTGYRLGYAAGPKGLVVAMNKTQSQTTTCPSSISQLAAVAALNGPQDFVRDANREYKARGALVVEGLAQIPGLKLQMPQGAFYAFPEVSAFIGKRTPDGQVINNDTELSAYLLRVGKVATVPGSAFGVEPYVRLSFATSRQELEQALGQLREAFAALA
ncbi:MULTISPECIES: pyridoxal phosphate-dependent aminotransferase [Pseudomonas]|uniref:Aminotransferase n=1 Tax=Pseudomonas putida (strain DOT-T1E) TaxID=1196325 RepID=I7CFM6_PSEPT|nr:MULTISPECIES: pyridoxal phosphate-dependent aminotransferase [Pseudomonas]AFO50689.1 aspartate aminotransferase B protein [Pseudomonas putida DOT-T1E]AYN10568.1 pyridoxal phosphate-dependent aminotransferase [Pseudomonas putida]UZM95633.1 pyridoxal phosphate-dependent aminotransferase [Pseudomonas putida DOT-T1E]WPO32543.1 pyridoxal phosphate-dependent aminotransferase [Pseudomonas sp. BO3-4]